MKIQRILGLLWMIFCSYACLQGLWGLAHYSVPLASASGCYIGIISLVYLVGAVASYLLLRRGTSWARIVVGCIAAFLAIMITLSYWKFRHISRWDGVLLLFAVVSIALLFLPRREPVA